MTDLALAADFLLSGLGRSCLQGGLFALLVLALCRMVRRLPARWRAVLWWLVSAKFVLTLFIGAAILIPVAIHPAALRISHAAAALALRSARPLPMPHPDPLPESSATLPAAYPDTFPEETVNAPAEAAAHSVGRDLVPQSAPVSRRALAGILLATAYVAGLFLCFLSGTVRGSVRLIRLLRTARPLSESSVQEAALEAAGAFGRSTFPRLVASDRVSSPCIVGVARPLIVLPESFLQTATPHQIRLALAHEIAHWVRGDLWAGLVPRLARLSLFFFPLAASACREWEQACEESCDQRALTAFPDTGPGDYGRLLLSLSVGKPRSRDLVPVLRMAAAPGFARLKRRLEALAGNGERNLSRAARLRAGLLAGLVALPGAIPWRLAAAAAATAKDAMQERLSALGSDAPPRFDVMDLGTLGGNYSDAFAISDSGRIVGASTPEATGVGSGQAFVWDAILDEGGRVRGVMTEAGEATLHHSVAQGVGSGGTVAGVAFDRPTRPQAFVWDGEKRLFLGALPGYRYSRAVGVSGTGWVAGTAQSSRRDDGETPARAVVWREGRSRDLGTLGGPYSQAAAISGTGIVVGKADLRRAKAQGETGLTHAFALDTTTPHALPRDLGTLPGGKNSRAFGVDARGTSVGYSETGNGETTSLHAFVRQNSVRDGAMQDLGTLPGTENSAAYGINDRGWIVGTAGEEAAVRNDLTTEAVDRRAVLWRCPDGSSGRGAGAPMDLNACIAPDSGWMLQTARAVNTQGWIVGQGRIDGKQHAFLLIPRQNLKAR